MALLRTALGCFLLIGASQNDVAAANDNAKETALYGDSRREAPTRMLQDMLGGSNLEAVGAYAEVIEADGFEAAAGVDGVGEDKEEGGYGEEQKEAAAQVIEGLSEDVQSYDEYDDEDETFIDDDELLSQARIALLRLRLAAAAGQLSERILLREFAGLNDSDTRSKPKMKTHLKLHGNGLFDVVVAVSGVSMHLKRDDQGLEYYERMLLPEWSNDWAAAAVGSGDGKVDEAALGDMIRAALTAAVHHKRGALHGRLQALKAMVGGVGGSVSAKLKGKSLLVVVTVPGAIIRGQHGQVYRIWPGPKMLI